MTLPDLHDWTLLGVSHDWERKTATIRVQGYRGEKCLVARGEIELSLSQLEPWGPSVSINKVVGPDVGSDEISTVQIEMQSGDVIRLRGRSISVH